MPLGVITRLQVTHHCNKTCQVVSTVAALLVCIEGVIEIDL